MQAAEMQQAGSGLLAFERGVVPLNRIATKVYAIRKVVLERGDTAKPSFGFWAIIPDSREQIDFSEW